jgi:hypothetical protein
MYVRNIYKNNKFKTYEIRTDVVFAVYKTDIFPVTGGFGTTVTPLLCTGLKQYCLAQNFKDILYVRPGERDKPLSSMYDELAFNVSYSVWSLHISETVRFMVKINWAWHDSY